MCMSISIRDVELVQHHTIKIRVEGLCMIQSSLRLRLRRACVQLSSNIQADILAARLFVLAGQLSCAVGGVCIHACPIAYMR